MSATIPYRRVIITRHGGPEVLQVIDDQLPSPQAHEVTVKVEAAGVSNPDVAKRVGVYPGAPKLPYTPGCDITGVVTAIGADVQNVRSGETVVALTDHGIGGYAEYINLTAETVVPAPAEINAAERVSIVLNYMTAYQLLHRIARVYKGERALIHSAGGGVGTALLQLGQLAGLEMYGTVSAGKHALVEHYGATPINYQNEDFVRRILELTGDGVDVALDPIGGSHFRRSFETLRNGGRLVGYGFQVGLPRGKRSLLGFLSGLLRQPRVTPFGLLPTSRGVFGYGIYTRPDWHVSDLFLLVEMLADRKIQPVIADCLPLENVREAHRRIDAGGVQGKLVLLNTRF